MGPATAVVTGGGDPTDEEMAAIVAAASALVLSPPSSAPRPELMPRWRFSGRWWVKPIPLRRRRPW